MCFVTTIILKTILGQTSSLWEYSKFFQQVKENLYAIDISSDMLFWVKLREYQNE